MASAAPAARQGITHHATQCEDALRLADFAHQQGLAEIAAGLRRLAGMHAANAWRWVPMLGKPRADA